MTELLIAADDRTGALEAAAACADDGLVPAVVVPRGVAVDLDAADTVVVDIGTRHLDAAAAGARAAALDGLGSVRRAHKIDSTLRGAWAHELVARQRAAQQRVLVAPALPALGRTCVGGVVLDGGVPVSEAGAGRDARRPVSSSRPREHLVGAGAPEVVEIGGALDVGSWLAGDVPFAVCDASTPDDLDRIASAWAATDDVLLATTAAGAGAAARAIVARRTETDPAGWAGQRPAVRGPVLVVCGSLHEAARGQLVELAARGARLVEVDADPARSGAPDVSRGMSGPPAAVRDAVEALRLDGLAVVVTASPTTSPVRPADADAAAAALAAIASAVVQEARVETLVVLGGDTAAAVLGDVALVVGGTLAPGTAWSHRVDGGGPLLITRSGAFGGRDALVELLSGTLPS